MKQNGTYWDLKKFRDDINSQIQEHVTFAMFHKQKISDFRTRNKMKLEHMDKCVKQMIKDFVEHDNEGNPIIVKKEGQPDVYQYESEEKKAAHDKAFRHFMSVTIVIEF